MKYSFSYHKIFGLFLLSLGASTQLWAANTPTDMPIISQQTLLLAMGVVALALLGVIGLLLAFLYFGVSSKGKGSQVLKTILIGTMLFGGFQYQGISQTPVAKDSASAAVSTFASDTKLVMEKGIQAKWSVFEVAYWVLFSLILIELIIIFSIIGRYLYSIYLSSIEKEDEERIASGKQALSWWERFNATTTLEEEKDLQLDHNYDGIRELDNSLPPWWIYGFYATILFAGIYLYRYHVSHSAPLMIEELTLATNQAEIEKDAYLKKSANSVDENTVVLKKDATTLNAGKAVFTTNCVVCHGDKGEGKVGPNLTDDYWIHGGSIKNLFTTIKYGVDGKGMRSWKEDLSPAQISQVSSYIKSLKGTNPPNAKAQEGALYEEEGTAAVNDSTAKP